jgi:hypothetical protein
MNWHDAGPKLSIDDVRSFERRTAESLPDDLIWLLMEVCNGGQPPTVRFPITEMARKKVIVQALYGIGHPDGAYSFEEAMEDLSEYGMSWRIPFG